MKTLAKVVLLVCLSLSVWQVAHALNVFDRSELMKNTLTLQFDDVNEVTVYLESTENAGFEYLLRFDKVTGKWNLLINDVSKSESITIDTIIKTLNVRDPLI